MITVSISINGSVVAARSARNTGNIPRPSKGEDGTWCSYLMDDGNVLFHRREDGAIKLAGMMLEKVKEI